MTRFPDEGAPAATTATSRRHEELARVAKAIIAAHATQRVPVGLLAAHLGCSVFHLCRVFRRVEGLTISACRTELRLRMAIDRLRADPTTDLTRLAMDCGYCSHSHFSAAFKRRLGQTPSSFALALLRAPHPAPGLQAAPPQPGVVLS